MTDPYCPSVGKMAPDDSPFITKRGEEFPAGHKKFTSHYAQQEVKTHT